MAVYNNFLNTPYESNNTLLLGTLSNYRELPPPNKAFIVYCDPKNIDYSDISALADAPYELSFRNQYISNKVIDLIDIFNSLKTYNNNNVSSYTRFTDDITIQKFFYPFYQSLMYKTVYSNILTVDDLLTQLDLYYGKQLTFADIQNLPEEDEINVIINYDLYCPYYEYPIRFVFQNIVKIP